MRDLPLVPEHPPAQPPSGRVRVALLACGLVLVGIAGYAGFVAYPKGDAPAAAGAGILVLGAAAGLASFFSPCSFPLLVTLLAREARGTARGGRVRATLPPAAAFALGAAAFVLALGALIGLGGRSIAASVTFTSTPGRTLRIVVGSVLVLLGLVQSGVVRLDLHPVERAAAPLREAHARLRRRRPLAGFAVFGLAYLLIGFG